MKEEPLVKSMVEPDLTQNSMRGDARNSCEFLYLEAPRS